MVTGDLLIGAVIPVHLDSVYPMVKFQEEPQPDICKMFLIQLYQHIQVLRYAVDEINKSPNLLPNTTLGFYVYDSCAVLKSELQGTLWMLTGLDQEIPNYCCRKSPPLTAIIGHSQSSYSILMAHILGLYKYPQISCTSTSSLLSDRSLFRSFFRTVPSDYFQSRGIAQLVLHFQWTWVGLLASKDDYGNEGVENIKKEIMKEGACVAFTVYLSTNMNYESIPNIVKMINESSSNVVIAFSADIYLIPILDEMVKQNITGKLFIASEAWSVSNVLSLSKYSTVLSGTMGLAIFSSKIPGFQDYLNSVNPTNTPGINWLRRFWEESFQCRFLYQTNFTVTPNNLEKPCTGTEDLKALQNSYNDVSALRSSYSIYTAVYVIAKALDDLTHCQSCSDLTNVEPWQKGKIFAVYTDFPSLRLQLLPYIKSVQLSLKNKRNFYFDKNGNPPAVYDILNWQPNPDGVMEQVKVGSYDTLNISGDVFNIDDSLVWWRTKNQQTGQCIVKAIDDLSYEDPLGIILAVTSLFSFFVSQFPFSSFIHYKSPPLWRANNYSVSCILLVSFIPFLSALTFHWLPPTSSLKKWTTPRVPYTIITIVTLVQLLLLLCWLSISPPFPQYNIESNRFHCSFLARRLPDNFNEAKLITFSMLAFLSVWVYFIPASLSARVSIKFSMENEDQIIDTSHSELRKPVDELANVFKNYISSSS
ncbi:hypothetical protein GDO86_007071 [Hymenochirus boettgeri]|uniref:G-protein coupled receptors family 3 profile domain-containing protein n=1 Tax=Hymenochirus boettgeri TaxID=247094 RepID=A0A8T2JB14_9PIPI|nr:hypothetical protein GDO86_007071 [Hymenochirus boettgeri]